MEKNKNDTAPAFRETDLALERSRPSAKAKGLIYKEAARGDVRFSAISVTEEAKCDGYAKGKTLSLSIPSPFLWSTEEKHSVRDAFRLALQLFFPVPPARLLVAGLGNRRLTADALGPFTAEAVEASATLPEALYTQFGLAPATRIAVCVPDVFSKTGIESVRSVEAAARLFEADAVLAFDALAAKDKTRLFRVIEITDTGTVPGAGVKQGSLSLSKDTLGIPVIAVGVPTVVRTDGEHFLVSRDMEEYVRLLSALLAEVTNTTFGGAEPLQDAEIGALFHEEAGA